MDWLANAPVLGVGLLLTQGAQKFIQNHAEVVFDGR